MEDPQGDLAEPAGAQPSATLRAPRARIQPQRPEPKSEADDSEVVAEDDFNGDVDGSDDVTDTPPPAAAATTELETTAPATDGTSTGSKKSGSIWGSLEPHAGWIQKKPVRKMQGGVRERFLALDGLVLSYYVDHTRRRVKGFIGINCTSSIRAVDARNKDGTVEFAFVFTEFQHATLANPQQLQARVLTKFELDLWIQRISDAIGFCYLIANAGPKMTPRFHSSIVSNCNLPFRHWKGECRVQLRGNLLWFESLEAMSARRLSRDSSNGVRGRAESTNSTSAGGTGTNFEALGCVSISDATRIRSLGDSAIAISSRYCDSAHVREKPVVITFLTVHTKERLMNDLNAVARCARAGMPCPPNSDLLYLKYFPCRIFLPNYLGYVVFMIPGTDADTIDSLKTCCHNLIQRVLDRTKRGKHGVWGSKEARSRDLFAKPGMEEFLASIEEASPKITLTCNAIDVSTKLMVQRLEAVAQIPLESLGFGISSRSSHFDDTALMPGRDLGDLWRAYGGAALWDGRSSLPTDDPAAKELQLDLRTGDSDDHRSDILTVTVPRHVTCHDLKGREFVKYVIEGSMGQKLTWTVERRYTDFKALSQQLEEYQRDHHLESVFLPGLPDSEARKIVKNTSIVTTRMRTLAQYLQALLAVPEWRGSPCFMQFIGMLNTARNQERRSVIHISKLLDWCDIGDLVLFRTLNPLSAIQRFGTASEWDHIGMVVISPINNRRALLEATGEGVTCYPLIGRLRAYSRGYAERMAVRHLRRKDGRGVGGGGSHSKKKRVGTPRYVSAAQRRAEADDSGPTAGAVRRALTDFAKRVRGKPYSLSAGKILLIKESTQDPQKFFCSELVAEALKVAGLVKGDRVSASWWPRDFQDGGNIESHLHDAWILEPTRELDMEETSFVAGKKPQPEQEEIEFEGGT